MEYRNNANQPSQTKWDYWKKKQSESDEEHKSNQRLYACGMHLIVKLWVHKFTVSELKSMHRR